MHGHDEDPAGVWGLPQPGPARCTRSVTLLGLIHQAGRGDRGDERSLRVAARNAAPRVAGGNTVGRVDDGADDRVLVVEQVDGLAILAADAELGVEAVALAAVGTRLAAAVEPASLDDEVRLRREDRSARELDGVRELRPSAILLRVRDAEAGDVDRRAAGSDELDPLVARRDLVQQRRRGGDDRSVALRCGVCGRGGGGGVPTMAAKSGRGASAGSGGTPSVRPRRSSARQKRAWSPSVWRAYATPASACSSRKPAGSVTIRANTARALVVPSRPDE